MTPSEYSDDQDDALNQPPDPLDRRSGLYVDVENLQSDGQPVILSLIENWPNSAPALARLSLYVRADQTELWRLWATSRFRDLDVVVKGTQHFRMSSTKNSADIAIAVNAMADLILKRVNHIVVLSNDSDFISLYAAVRDEPNIPLPDGKVPFLWAVTDNESSLSTSVKRFFPPDELHIVTVGRKKPENTAAPAASTDIWDAMAEAVLEDIEIGPFKSTDCQPVIKKRWPDHPLSDVGRPKFGIEFNNNIWPVIEKAGVKIRNPGKKPIQYEMTSEAKNALKPPPTNEE